MKLTTVLKAFLVATLGLFATVLADGHKLKVVASFSIVGDLVQQVGGDRVDLTVIVGPDIDSHVYRPRPQDSIAVAEADVVLVNGAGFEGWMPRLIASSGFSGVYAEAIEGADLLMGGHAHDDHDEHHDEHEGHHDDHDEHHDEHEGHHDHHDEHHDEREGHHDHRDEHHDEHEGHHDDHDEHHDEHEGHHDDHDEHHDEHEGHHDEHDEHHDDHDEHHDEHEGHHDEHEGHHDEQDEHHAEGVDPHAWHSIDNAKTYVLNIAAALSQAAPIHKADFEANAQSYLSVLDELEEELSAVMAPVPADKRTVIAPHDAFAYLGEAYGINFTAAQGMSTEAEPSARDIANLIRQVREQQVGAIFAENVTNKKVVEQIARETGLTVETSPLYSDALSAQPDGPATYVELMRVNVTTLAAALLQ